MLRGNIYLIDVNPVRGGKHGNGLNHQLWCVVNALMIGEYTSRNIMVSGFYPDYNLDNKMNICNIIDIDKTNEKLQEGGFNVRLLPYDSQLPWTRTAYPNPVFNKFVKIEPAKRFHSMIEALRNEEHIRYVDLWSSFVWPIMNPYGYNNELVAKATTMFLSIVPSSMIRFIVSERSVNLTDEYDVIHLRLEDDWMIHITETLENIHNGKTIEDCTKDIYQEILGIIDEKLSDTENNDIYIATGLNNGENINKYILEDLEEKYPGRLVYKTQKTCDWSKIFPNAGPCRDIEAYLDLLICLDGKRFIGGVLSSFSSSLKHCFRNQGKPFYQYKG